MSEIKDGGPAFPGKATINRTTGELMPHQFGNDDFATLGMTLRDYFAAKALAALIDRKEFDRFDLTAEKAKTIGECAALRAYAIADAMLRARGAA